MNKRLIASGLIACLAAGMSFTANAEYVTASALQLQQSFWGSTGAGPGNGQFADNIAGTWVHDANGSKYRLYNDTYCRNGWYWLDGNEDGIAECYMFDNNGYAYKNTTTPDNFIVNADGCWVLNGVVQTKHVSYDNTTSASDVNRVTTTAYNINSSGPGELTPGFTDSEGEGWKSTGTAIKYQLSDGTYARGGWYWLDGDDNGIYECYYFGDDGVLYVNTTTPDGYTVGSIGAWEENGKVKQRYGGYDGAGGNWKIDNNGWRYDYADGSHPQAGVNWLDGNRDGISECYYFDSNGYIRTDATVGSMYFNSSGQLVENGQVVTRKSGADTSGMMGEWILTEVRTALLANPNRIGSVSSISDMQAVTGIPEVFADFQDVTVRTNEKNEYFVVPKGGKWYWFEKKDDSTLSRWGASAFKYGSRMLITGGNFPDTATSGRYYVGVYERKNG